MKLYETRRVSLLASNIEASLHASKRERIADIYGFVASQNARGQRVAQKEIQKFLNLGYLRTMQLLKIMVDDGWLTTHIEDTQGCPYTYIVGNLPILY